MECLFLSDLGFPSFQLDRQVALINLLSNWHFRFVWIAGTGLAAFFINIAVENFSGWKFAATFAVMKYSYFLGLLIYILFNAALVFSSVYIITQFAPAAAGSGIPEIKAYLNGMLQCNYCFTSISFNIYENVGGRGTWTSFQVSSIWKLRTSIFFCVWCTLNLVWYQAFLCCRYWYSWYSPVPDSHWKGVCCVIPFTPPTPNPSIINQLWRWWSQLLVIVFLVGPVFIYPLPIRM